LTLYAGIGSEEQLDLSFYCLFFEVPSLWLNLEIVGAPLYGTCSVTAL